MRKKHIHKKLLSALLTVILLCQTIIPAFAESYNTAGYALGPSGINDTVGSQPAQAEAMATSATQAGSFSDMVPENSWSYKALTAAIDAGLLKGNNGKLNPYDNITRAEMITIGLRALGLDDSVGRDLTPFETDIGSFKDVQKSDWYFDEIAMAYKLKLLNGISGSEMFPSGIVSREMAFTILCRLMGLDETYADMSALNKFTDANQLSEWAKPYAAAMTAEGYVSGSGGVLNPQGAITRQEFAQLMYNLFGSNYISAQNTADALSGKTVTGNIVVSGNGFTLSGLTVNGDVVIGDGVGNYDATLDGVNISGRLIVRGGGENTIYL